jgi:hypothetical protein
MSPTANTRPWTSSKEQAVLSELEMLQAMFDIGYFPPNTRPG